MTTTSPRDDLDLERDPALDPALGPAPDPAPDPARLEQTSARCGLGYAAGQLLMTVAFGVLVLPAAGPPDAGPVSKGRALLEHADLFTAGNYLLVLPSLLLLGFLGVVAARLRRADPSGTLAAVAVAAGTLVALLWPLGAVLHDLALDTAQAGVDVRVAAAWDAVGPYTLALSAVFRTGFVVAVTTGLVGAPGGLRRSGWAVAGLSLLGSATLVVDGAFAVLAVSTLAFDGWVAALAWRWSRSPR